MLSYCVYLCKRPFKKRMRVKLLCPWARVWDMTESDRANYWWMELQNMEEDCGLSRQSESESFPLGMVQKILYLRGNVGVIVTVIYILPKRRSEVNDRFSKIFMLVLKAKPWTEWPTQCTIHVLKINLKSFLPII